MSQIVVTGAAGFIASNLARKLNQNDYNNLILVDKFDSPERRKNLEGIQYSELMERDAFTEWFTDNADEVSFVFHLGARTDTTEFNFRIFDSLNVSYSKTIWEICTVKQIPLVYASSAATYGMGEHGFDDSHELVRKLKPLNPYGLSKQLVDVFVLDQKEAPPFWAGLKFFNVYGPHENHKGRMASVVYHAYHQIKQTGKVKLFESHNPNYANGEQLRDFIHVDDITEICMYFFNNREQDGIYNAGTGKARSFNALATAIFKALNLPVDISYIPTPMDIRDKYQYYTEAKMDKLLAAGYTHPFFDLEEGVEDYVKYLELNS
jgi:ADP-L-glycero-D-manno-heptose 6-epimerase